MKKALFRFILLGTVSLISVRCIEILDRLEVRDLDQIKESRTLNVVTLYGANTYFLYRGRPMGLEYELATAFARHLGVKLEIILTRDTDNVIHMLNSGRGDLVAAGTVVTRKRARRVFFTEHLYTTRQVLVQNKIVETGLHGRPVRNPVDLIGKRVHVREGSHHAERLKNLAAEIGGQIDIVEVDDPEIITEDLIRSVAEKEIRFTVAEDNVARMNSTYLSNLDVSTEISFPQRVAWITRETSPELTNEANLWIQKMKKSGYLQKLYRKYYYTRKNFRSTEYHSLGGGRISRYDRLIRKHAAVINWDWRLLASLIYQESRFNPRARSWAGAGGLMQLMPATARQLGVGNVYRPESNISGGVRFLRYLKKKWQHIEDEEERLKFVLASYNAGPGHVEDARRLAAEYGRNPDLWDRNTAYFMIKLTDPRYYNDPVVKHGYCRGDEPYHYVKEIIERYTLYRKMIDKKG